MNDDEYAAEYSSVPSDLRALWASTHTDEYGRDDDAEADYYSDRFQHPDGVSADYAITVQLFGGTRTKARLLADLIRDVVRRNEERVNCPVCKGSRWVKGYLPGAIAYRDGSAHTHHRRCTACKDGTVLAGPAAIVTFEAPAEVGAEATPYVPADHVARMLAESRRRHPANRAGQL